MYRYTMTARAFGPYWVAASTPAGPVPVSAGHRCSGG
jgi:hypothetical protein